MAGCDYSVDSKFPTASACVQVAGYSNTQQRNKQYLGGVSNFERMTIDAVAVITGKENLNMFALWWYLELSGGTKPFSVTIPIFGVERSYMAKIINDLSPALVNDSVDGYEIKMVLEIQEDISITIEEDFCNSIKMCEG